MGLTRQEVARRGAELGAAANTVRSYAKTWHHFSLWKPGAQLPILAEQVEEYVLWLDQCRKKMASIEVCVNGLKTVNRWFGYQLSLEDEERVARILRIVKKLRSKESVRQASPVLRQHLQMLSDTIDQSLDLIDMRDLTLLLVGWHAALRRSEIAALSIDDVELLDDKALVLIQRSKTDQEGIGAILSLPAEQTALCPLRALRRWLPIAHEHGAAHLFPRTYWGRTVWEDRIPDREISAVVKKWAEKLSWDIERPDLFPAFSGHSLRAGFITQALHDGMSVVELSNRSRHRLQELTGRGALEYFRAGVSVANMAKGVSP